MVTTSRGSVYVLSRLKAFGPTKQSFEIKNGAKKEVTVFLERLGSEHFRLSDSLQKFTMKPGATARVQVEFYMPENGCAIALNATYKAVINVWVLGSDNGAKKELVDVLRLTATGPGFVSCDSLQCFVPTSSPERRETERRAG